MQDNRFFDTSVLVYAFDKDEPTKQATILKRLQEMKDNEEKGVISSQVLLELYNVLTRFLSSPLSQNEAASIVNDFIDAAGWIKLDYKLSTAKHAVSIATNHKAKIWDTLIVETMKENNIYTIVTENEKDFKKIPGVKIINPFR